MLPFRALIFDFDGVIAHTAPIVKQALWRFFREKEIAILEKDFETDGYATKSLEQVCALIATKYGMVIESNALRAQIWQTQVNLMNEGLVFDPHLLALLEFCRQKNIVLGIGSNSSRARIEWITDVMNIRDYFGVIVGADDVTEHKPDPEVWIQCAHHFGLSHDVCCVIEDGLPGLVGAQICGMKSVYYHRYTLCDNECQKRAHYHTDNFADIIKMISSS